MNRSLQRSTTMGQIAGVSIVDYHQQPWPVRDFRFCFRRCSCFWSVPFGSVSNGAIHWLLGRLCAVEAEDMTQQNRLEVLCAICVLGKYSSITFLMIYLL